MNREKQFKKYKNLPQYKDYTDEQIYKLIDEKIEQDEIISSLSFCLESEKPLALKLLNNYLSEASFENYSERDTLIQLIGLEILAERIRLFLRTEADKSNPSIPLQMVEQLTNLSKQILELKEKLGLTKKESKNTLDEWNKLKAKALAYYKESAGCNVVKCPECKKLYMILKDVRGHTTEKIKFFRKTLLYNKPMFEWYDKKIITKEQLAEALGVSVDYIDLIYENIYKNDR